MTLPIMLITGFTPFHGFQYNSAQEILSSFHNLAFRGMRIVTFTLPTNFERCFPALCEVYQSLQPRMVLSFGMHAGSDSFQVEARARNLMRIEQGRTSSESRSIDGEGSNFRYTQVAVGQLVSRLQNDEIPIRLSFNAGTYVCNYLYYRFLGFLREQETHHQIPYLFVHIPAFPVDAQKSKRVCKGMLFPRMIMVILKLLTEVITIDHSCLRAKT